MLLVSFRSVFKSFSLMTHLGFIVLLALLALVSLSVLGLFTSLYNFHENLILIKSEGLVISSYAASPLTSVVSEKYVNNLISGVEGVEVEPLVFSLAYVKGRTVVIRGVEEASIPDFYQDFKENISCVLAGEGLAKELGLREGETLTLYSLFTKEPILVSVCGIKHLPSLLNYELITSIELSRVIRGISNDYYSVVVLRADNLSVLSSISMKLGLSSSDATLLKKALLVLSYQGNALVHELHSNIPEAYMAKLGIHRDLVFTLSYAIATLVIISDLLIGEYVFRLSKRCVNILRFLGVPRKRIFATLALQVMTYVVLAAFTTLVVFNYFSGFIRLEVVSHYVSPQISLHDSLLVFSFKTLLLLTGVLWGFMSYEE